MYRVWRLLHVSYGVFPSFNLIVLVFNVFMIT